MQKRRFTPLFSPGFGKLASVCLIALFTGIFTVSANAQTEGDGFPAKNEYNKDVRTGTWSIHAQGGFSWANGVWYENINAKKSYGFSPAVGGGFDYTIRPWVRVGAEYLWAAYRREQRITNMNADVMPMKAYGTYHVNHHNVKLGAGFNFMELWPSRNAQWFNIWVGTGLGYTIADTYEYSCFFSTTITQDGVSKPVTGNIDVSNSSTVSIQGNVRTDNVHSSYKSLYVPASLNLEFDVTRQFALGVKGEIDWVLGNKDLAPKNMVYGLATLRYNFVPGKAKVIKKHYESRYAVMDSELKDALRRAEQQKERADKAEADRMSMVEENAKLKKRLDDCENSKVNMVIEKPEYKVLFDNNSATLTKEMIDQLKAFAMQYKGEKISLLAEASVSGSKVYNQRLSERRLENVVKAMEDMGFTAEDLKPRLAIGAQRGIDSAEGRCVTLTVE